MYSIRSGVYLEAESGARLDYDTFMGLLLEDCPLDMTNGFHFILFSGVTLAHSI